MKTAEVIGLQGTHDEWNSPYLLVEDLVFHRQTQFYPEQLLNQDGMRTLLEAVSKIPWFCG